MSANPAPISATPGIALPQIAPVVETVPTSGFADVLAATAMAVSASSPVALLATGPAEIAPDTAATSPADEVDRFEGLLAVELVPSIAPPGIAVSSAPTPALPPPVAPNIGITRPEAVPPSGVPLPGLSIPLERERPLPERATIRRAQVRAETDSAPAQRDWLALSEGEPRPSSIPPAAGRPAERDPFLPPAGMPPLASPAPLGPGNQGSPVVHSAAAASAAGQQLFAHALQSGVDTLWLDRVTDGITAVARGTADLRVRMDTEALGQITVAMALAETSTKVRIGVADERTRDAVEERTAKASANATAFGAPLSAIAVEVDRQRQNARGATARTARAKIETHDTTPETARRADRHRYA